VIFIEIVDQMFFCDALKGDEEWNIFQFLFGHIEDE